MQPTPPLNGLTRRSLLKKIGATCGGAALGALDFPSRAFAQPSNAKWANQIGLELITVRDRLVDDFEGTIAKLAEIGYKELEPSSGFGGLTPRDFRKLMDKYGLSAVSTHNSPTIGLDLEKQFEGYEVMGIKYSAVPFPPRLTPAPVGKPTGAYIHGRNFWTQSEAFVPERKAGSLEEAQRRAADLNKYGKISKRFGIKILVHNHVDEFDKLMDSDQCAYDVFLKECDPELTTLQLDIAWAIIAGQDILSLFRKNPRRFELWHMKDVFGLVGIDTSLDVYHRANRVTFVPYGTGQIDYKPFFDSAELAGLKHFCIEQDDGPVWGDSLAAARVSYKNLRTMLTTGSVPDAYYR